MSPPEASTAVLAAACRHAAAVVDADGDERGVLVARARQTWEGPARVAFDGALRAHERRAGELAVALRRLAARVEGAVGP